MAYRGLLNTGNAREQNHSLCDPLHAFVNTHFVHIVYYVFYIIQGVFITLYAIDSGLVGLSNPPAYNNFHWPTELHNSCLYQYIYYIVMYHAIQNKTTHTLNIILHVGKYVLFYTGLI